MHTELEAFLTEHYPGGPYRVEQTLHTNGLRRAYQVLGAVEAAVVKITDPERPEVTVLCDAGIQAYLAEHGAPVPSLWQALDGRLVLPYENRFVYMQTFIVGQPPHPVTSLYARLGCLMAQLHTLSFDAGMFSSSYQPDNILAESRALLLQVEPPEQRALLPELLCAIDHFPSFVDLPRGIIHSDPYLDNLLETPSGELYLIDWDDGGISYPLLDVGYVVAHLCSFSPRDRRNWGVPGPAQGPVFRADWAAEFLQAYQDIRPLTALERSLLPQAVQLAFLAYLPIWDTHLLAMDMYDRMKLVESAELPV